MPEKPPGLFSSPEKRNVILCLLLVVATLALYNPVNRHPFVNYDDDRYVTGNAHIHNGVNWGTISLGLFVHRAGELASAHLAVARARLSTLPPEPCRTPFHQRADSRRERRPSVFIFDICHPPSRTKPVRGGAICASSHQCRVGGLGGGAKERPVHVLLLRDPHRLLLVCAAAGVAPVPGVYRPICFGIDVEADGHHSPVCTPAARLLAVGQDAAKSSRFVAAGKAFETHRGEIAPARAFRCQRGNHHAGPARGWGRALHRAVLAQRAPGKCGCSLRHVFVENDLAVPSGADLSPSRRFSGRMASGGVVAGAAGGDRRGADFP